MLSVMTRGTGDRRAELGKTITLLRESARLSVDAAAASAPMSATTWKRVEDGKTVRGLTYRGIEEVLRLPRGVIDDAVEGRIPVSAVESRPATPATDRMLEYLDRTPELTDRERAQLKHVAAALRDERDSA